MKPFKSIIRVLHDTFAALLTATFLLYTLLSATATTRLLRLVVSSQLTLTISSLTIILPLVYLLHCLYSRPRIYLLDFSCFKPGPDRKCTLEASLEFLRRSGVVSPESEAFMMRILMKSGLGCETYGPPFMFDPDGSGADHRAKLESAMQEAQEGVVGAVDSLLLKTGITPDQIDVVLVTCGGFSPTPSLSSFVVNRYKMRDDVKMYNLSGMGCSSGVLSMDLAARLLRCHGRKPQYALVLITESISLNWYSGDNRSMLVTNSIFRVGCAAALMTNDPKCRRSAKMELVHSLRTHHSDDRSYRAAIQEEDERGQTGVSLTKDLIPVAAENLREHIKILGPRVLPLRQLFLYAYSVVLSRVRGSKPTVPDFTTAFDHICIHTGGRAVIEQTGRALRLGEEVTEPARMTLHRFGNTSSSLVLYELAYFEAKWRVKRGDRLWMLAFGTGFKAGSLVWRSLKDSRFEDDNPWNDCIDRYPVSW